MSQSWYDRAKAVITQVKLQHPDVDRKALRILCSKAYPFGERRNHPYKAWCRAMREELGMSRRCSAEGQGELFK